MPDYMPIASLSAVQGQLSEAGRKDFGYQYDNPGFRPGKPLHDMIVAEVNARMLSSKMHMQSRYDEMGQSDEMMNSFISMSDVEKRIKAKDPRIPVATVVPVQYALGQTLHTQCLSLYAAQESLHQFAPGGPEDTIGTALAEKIIARQSVQFKELDAISTQIWDNIKYGFGVVMPVWETKFGMTTSMKPVTVTDPNTGLPMPSPSGEMQRIREEVLLYEGNNVRNVDPYRYFPDPNTSLNRTQDGEFEGYTAMSSRFRLLEAEQLDPTRWMNAKYIKEIWGENQPVTSVMDTCYDIESTDVGIQGVRRMKGTGGAPGMGREARSNSVHLSFCCITLIPAEWSTSDGAKLGPSTKPQKYMFGVAGDALLVACHPLDLDHDMYGGCVMATDSDGYSCIARSPLEVSRPMMEAINYVFNLHMAFLRRFYKGRFAGDPEKFDLKAFMKGADFIPTTRLAFGTKINDILQPIPVPNVTGNYAADIGTMLEMVQRATGATDPILGVLSGGERKSATEAQGVLKNALGRMEKAVLLSGIQSHQDLGYKMLCQTQQFMAQETYVRMAGRWESELMEEFGKQAQANGWAADSKGFFPVRPADIDVWADVVPIVPNKRGEQSFDVWVTLLQSVLARPEMQGSIDTVRLFKHIARIGGAQNASDFLMQNPISPLQVMEMQSIQQQVQKGNMINSQQAQNLEGVSQTPDGVQL